MTTFRNRLLLTLVASFAVAIVTPKADACMFGLFGCRHKKKADCGATQANYLAPCNSCAPVMAVAAAPACNACAPPPPQPIAVTQTVMQQRCYMAPVTVMETRTATEPVTSYQTSTYLEPVTTMRTSAYYDPCNCGYTAVQTPVTSYVQKQQVTPITTYVQRHYQVPVTRYEQRTVMEPVTQTHMYYPAQAAIPAAAAIAQPMAVTAGPLAVPPPQQSQYLQPYAAAQPQVAQYQQPQQQAQGQQPQPQQQQQANPQQGNWVERNYQQPTNPADKTTLIERIYRNGQMIEEKTQYIAPGQQMPAPRNADGSSPATKSSYMPPNPPALRPIPVERTAWIQPRSADLQWTALQR